LKGNTFFFGYCSYLFIDVKDTSSRHPGAPTMLLSVRWLSFFQIFCKFNIICRTPGYVLMFGMLEDLLFLGPDVEFKLISGSVILIFK
jgi:hypothetical protein